jgi:histidinol-phosphate aminotransferase
VSHSTNHLLSLIRPDIQAMNAYKVSDATGMIKLDAMENPFGWPDQMKSDWLELMANVDINRYPDPSASELVNKLRTTFGISDKSGVVLGNGSDELIQLILMSLKSGSSVLVPDPTFVMYKQISTSLGLVCEGVPLQTDFSLNMPMMIKAIKELKPAVIFLAYPNNPTANLFDETDIMQIIEVSDGLVVVDEAYQPFAGKTFLQKLSDNYPQLLVMRTVSKLGLAGLRLGYLVGNKEILNQFEKVRLPYNINVFTQITAAFAFDHIEELDKQAELICQQRDFLNKELSNLAGLVVYSSKANFILFSLVNKKAEQVFKELKKQAILIKLMGNAPGLPEQCLRVTVGTKEQNMQFISALKVII